MYSRIILFFGFLFLPSFSLACSTPDILSVVANYEDLSYNLTSEKREELEEKLFSYIESEKLNYSSLDSSTDYFLKKQDKKFSLALAYLDANLSNQNLQTFAQFGPSQKALKTLDELSKLDFFTSFYSESLKKTSSIPSSVLLSSLLLDSFVSSCVYLDFANSPSLEPGLDNKEVFAQKFTKKEFFEEQIKKQNLAIRFSIEKYQSLESNYKIHQKLQELISQLKKLKLRFVDLSKLIGFLPAKLIDFGFEKK